MIVLVSVLAIGLGLAAGPEATAAAGGCRADHSILGQAPGVTGPTATDWFNVLGMDFDPGAPATLTFGVPVIPWSVEQPTAVQPAVTRFEMPAAAMSAGFKWTFRSRDPGIEVIRVDIAGPGCHASTIVDFTPPATSTAGLPATGEPPQITPILLLLAFVGGLLATPARRTGRPRPR